ncbi:hypothetical protein ACS0TY_000238 [Phlomoides rotata]
MASVKWLPITTASLGMFFFIASSFSEKASYPSFARDATSAAETEYYDYIIVGGGTAGCAVAATLSSTTKVLLLERGGLPYNNPNITHMTGLITTLSDTSPNSAAQQFVSTDGVSNVRGRVLGGGSAINGGFYSRASMEHVEEVAWEPRLVNESYEWVEKKVVFRPALLGWEVAVRDGLVEAGLMPDNGFTYEHMQGTKIGGTIFDDNGYRHTAADLLEYADPTMITVYLHASVHQILFETLPGKKPKAYGVVFKDSKDNNHTALLNKKATSEIIVSAGALGSPQLLMLSGIGPAQHLKAHGIYVILDQPMVGQGMSDNPMNAVIVPSPRPVETSFVKVVGITDDVGCYIEEICGLFGLGLLFPNNQSLIQSITIVEKVARPFSTGYLELQSNDPEENPRVTFNYFQDPRDLQRCVKGLEIIKRVVESKAFSEYRYPSTTFESLMKLVFELSKNRRRKHRITGVDSWEQFCIDTMITVYHYHGGCQVGRVVDPNYRVMGVESLRVIDGSTFYNSPGTNPQATLMMLGRYMGQKILQQ